MKRFAWLLAVLLLMCAVRLARAEGQIRVLLDDFAVSLAQPPYMEGDWVMVPVRSLCEEVGCAVGYDEATQTITLSNREHALSLHPGSVVAQANEWERRLPVPVVVREGRAFAPAESVLELLGHSSSWDPVRHTLTIAVLGAKVKPPAQFTGSQKATSVGDLTVTIILDKSAYQPYNVVWAELKAHNTGSAPVTLVGNGCGIVGRAKLGQTWFTPEGLAGTRGLGAAPLCLDMAELRTLEPGATYTARFAAQVDDALGPLQVTADLQAQELGALSVTVQADRVRVVWDDRALHLIPAPFLEGGTTWVPVPAFLEHIGFSPLGDNSFRRGAAILRLEGETAWVDGKVWPQQIPLRERNGTTYIPIRVPLSIIGAWPEWEPERWVVRVRPPQLSAPTDFTGAAGNSSLGPVEASLQLEFTPWATWAELRIRNNGDKPVTLTSNGCHTVGIVDPGGGVRAVPELSAGYGGPEATWGCPGAQYTEVLDPGAELAERFAWRPRGQSETVTARILVGDEPLVVTVATQP